MSAYLVLEFAFHFLESTTSSLEMQNIKAKTFVSFQKDDPKSGKANFLPFNKKFVWFPLPGTTKVIKNKGSSDSKYSTDHFEGRFFRFFKPFKRLDQKQLLFSNLNRIGDAYVSIAESLKTISTSWKFEFSNIILMDVTKALNKIADNCANSSSVPDGGK
ncbi:UNVERIFIED_CONTAM: hypothetical protein RMT77_016841 [Armadillidium vulgare]